VELINVFGRYINILPNTFMMFGDYTTIRGKAKALPCCGR